MSGICGIVNFDGSPVDPELLRKMAEAAAYRGPDGIRYWIEGNVGFAHLALNTTPESLRERQPLVNRRGDLVLTADARVDNRDELIRTLTSRGYIEDKDPTDADLILASYECWGEDCPRHIIGDFAFAIWDKRERRLFAARDPLGIRPMFYSKNGQNLIIGSAISMILAGLSTRPPMNDYFIVDFLCWRFERWIDETIWQDILRLPRSYTLIAGDGKLDLIQNWFFGQGPALTYKRDEEYVDHFRELFAEAIRVRSRSISDIGISMSGGLDSSSIACMAHHMVETGSIKNRQFRLYSVAFSRFPSADERVYQDAVAEKCRLFPHNKIDGDQIWGLQEFGADNGFPLDEPEIFQIRSMLTKMIEEATADGCKVVLSGEGGDQIMNSSAYWNPILLLDIRLRSLPSEMIHYWRRSKFSLLESLVFEVSINSIKHLMPRFVRDKFGKIRRRSSFPAWINPRMIEFYMGNNGRFSLKEKTPPLGRSAIQIYNQLICGWYSALISYLDRVIGFLGMEYRFPFLDRKVIEYLLIVPFPTRNSNGVTKKILREAMEGILPEKIKNRQGKCYFDDVFSYGLFEKEKEKQVSLFRGLYESQNDYLELEKFHLLYKLYLDRKIALRRSGLSPLFLQAWLLNACPKGEFHENRYRIKPCGVSRSPKRKTKTL